MAELRISPEVKKELRQIRRYIAKDLDNPKAATAIVRKITEQIKKLQDFPNLGTPLSAHIAFETSYRFLVCGEYLVFYRVENDGVYVDLVVHGQRDYIRILFGTMPFQ